jgi:uncharacterized protein (TIGR02145 family)
MKIRHFPLAVVFATILLAFSAILAAPPLEYDGKTYKTVKIGKQTWMAENLNYEAEGSKCYKNNPDNCAKYGRLYDWETATKACPKGWHLPSYTEWSKLLRFVDNGASSARLEADKHLKAASGWNQLYGLSSNGTDDYGFSALPGGFGRLGYFYGAGYFGLWWSATPYGDYNSYMFGMSSRFDGFLQHDHDNDNLYSVRCLRD